MRAYSVRRVVQMIPVLFLGSVVVWAMVHALPGDPAASMAGDDATVAQIEAVRERLGLNEPLVMQYATWLGDAVTGDLGYSYSSSQSVLSLLLDRIPATIQLAAVSMIIGLGLALPLGMASALRPRSLLGRLSSGYQAIGLAMPTFWLGLLMIVVVSVQLGWLPSATRYVAFWSDPVEALRNTIMPAAAIGIHVSGITARFVATSLREVMGRDFVRTARAKGASERTVVLRHALRNALLPIVTIAGLQLGAFLGGTIVIEVVFNYPGLGRLVYGAVSTRDYAVVQGAVVFVVVVFLVLNLAVDLLYAFLDPRIHYD